MREGLKAAEELKHDRIDVEMADPRTLYVIDMTTILKSIEKTAKLVVAHQAPKLYGGANMATYFLS